LIEKNLLTFKIYRDNNTKQKLLERIGVYETPGKKKLVYTQDSVMKQHDLSVIDSVHFYGLQRSRYITLDASTQRRLFLGKNVNKYLQEEKRTGKNDIDNSENRL
jgi:hypothetical protein